MCDEHRQYLRLERFLHLLESLTAQQRMYLRYALRHNTPQAWRTVHNSFSPSDEPYYELTSQLRLVIES